jgi:hypothetical protein
MDSGSASSGVLIFVAGAVLGLLVGWWAARSLTGTAPADNGARPAAGLTDTFFELLKKGALIAVAIIILLLLASNVAHSKR